MSSSYEEAGAAIASEFAKHPVGCFIATLVILAIASIYLLVKGVPF